MTIPILIQLILLNENHIDNCRLLYLTIMYLIGLEAGGLIGRKNAVPSVRLKHVIIETMDQRLTTSTSLGNEELTPPMVLIGTTCTRRRKTIPDIIRTIKRPKLEGKSLLRDFFKRSLSIFIFISRENHFFFGIGFVYKIRNVCCWFIWCKIPFLDIRCWLPLNK